MRSDVYFLWEILFQTLDITWTFIAWTTCSRILSSDFTKNHRGLIILYYFQNIYIYFTYCKYNELLKSASLTFVCVSNPKFLDVANSNFYRNHINFCCILLLKKVFAELLNFVLKIYVKLPLKWIVTSWVSVTKTEVRN